MLFKSCCLIILSVIEKLLLDSDGSESEDEIESTGNGASPSNSAGTVCVMCVICFVLSKE